VENLGAFMPATLGGEGAGSRGLLYIDLKILAETLPLSLLTPALCLALIARVHGDSERRPLCFQFSLLLSVALFFSVASMKRDDYILPALPSLAILLASLFTIQPEPTVATSGGLHRWRKQIDSLGCRRWFFLSRAVTLILAGAGTLLLMGATLFVAHGAVRVGTLDFRFQPTDSRYADLFVAGMSRLSLPFLIFFVTLAIAELLLFGSLVRRYTPGMGAGLALLSLACVSLWTGTLRPELNRRRSLKQFAEEMTRQTHGAEVYYFEDPPREISFYSGRYIAQFQRTRGWCSAPNRPIYLILPQREAAVLPRRCVERLKSVLVADNASADRPGLFEFAAKEQEP
jgi:4-amino-4-deoxy-L-arabinose transferase-like glycosyltransferase